MPHLSFSHEYSYRSGCLCHVSEYSLRMKCYIIKHLQKKHLFFLVPGYRSYHFRHLLQNQKLYMMARFSSNHSLDLYLPKSLGPWFKSYSNFAEYVDFAFWWSFIEQGLRLQPAQKACFFLKPFEQQNF